MGALESKVGQFLDFIHEKVDDVVAERHSWCPTAGVDVSTENPSVVIISMRVILAGQVKTNQHPSDVSFKREGQIVERVGIAVVENDEIHIFDKLGIEIELGGMEKDFTVLWNIIYIKPSFYFVKSKMR